MIDPKQYYKAQQLEHRNILKVLQNKELYLFIARLLSGFSSLSLLIWGFYTKSIELGLGGVISLLLFIIVYIGIKAISRKLKNASKFSKLLIMNYSISKENLRHTMEKTMFLPNIHLHTISIFLANHLYFIASTEL